MTETRLITPLEGSEEEAVDRVIRPKRLKDYIGQKAMREQMGIFIKAARGRSEPLDHLLILNPTGLGYTTLAHIIPTRWA
jgi:Holliday junction DNA helicase RuvB